MPRLLSILVTLMSTTNPTLSSPGPLRIWFDAPASQWEHALPLGSGRLGAMVFGGIRTERIQFNEETLWTGRPRDYVREGAGEHLAEIRRLIFEGQTDAAADLVRARFLSDPVRQKAYQPFGDLRFEFDHADRVTDYRRELDLDTATATVSYRLGDTRITRRTFTSHPERAIVTRVESSASTGVSFALSIDSPHRHSSVRAIGNDTLALSGQVRDPAAPDELGLRFETRVRGSADGGTISIADGRMIVRSARSATILLVAATSFVDFEDMSGEPSAVCASDLDRLAGRSFDQLHAKHVSDHQRLFHTVRFALRGNDADATPTDRRVRAVADDPAALDTDPALAALYFQFGRYLLIASSRPDGEPANLQGVWNELLAPPWESKYTTNINLQMNYWPAEVTNLVECHQPLFDLVDDLRVSGPRTARKMYGARGWVLHHNTDLWRGTAPINNIDGMWPTGGAWLCHHLWEHYQFGGDESFLRDRAYPAMKEASLFFLDALVPDPKTGWLVTNPSHSPEQGPLCAGPAMDMQLVRWLFDATIESANILGVDADVARVLTEARSRLAPDQVGRHGQLQEWIDDIDVPENNHRHLSPLWGLFPGAQFTPEHPHLFDAARRLLQWRGDGSTGWSYAWRMPLWARVGDGEFAYRQLALQLSRRTFPNLLDKCGPFQVDGNFGATAGIAEMLLQSHRRAPDGRVMIELLPALPTAWPAGSITGLRARGGFEVDVAWEDGRLSRAVVRSGFKRPCVLVYADRRVDLTGSEVITLDRNLTPVSEP